MCGIAGFYNLRDDRLLKKISSQLSHRGPDGAGFFINENVSLLNRRLAIIDVTGGDQPIFNEDRSVVVVYNGEIYNYLALRKELENLGHIFKTKSDTEVIVHGYEQWGEKYFNRLNGMFAIALWDSKKEKLVLARDHFGIKPLYYAIDSRTPGVRKRLIFSSEIKPIFESGFVEKKPNDRIIYRYLNFRIHDDQKETFFENIFKLLPGEMMTVQNFPLRPAHRDFEGQAKFEIRKYTNLEKELINTKTTNKFDQNVVYEFNDKLIEAIKLRLISEVPVGSCLSGGLDSSTIVSVVNKLLKEKIKEASSVGKKQKVFSAVFPDGTNNEEKYVDEVLKFRPKADRPLGEKLESYKVEPKPEKFFEEIEEFVKTQEEPTISTGPYAQFKVMEEASKHVTVLLDGQGADEMMAGYLPYYFVYFHQLFKEKKYWELLKESLSSLDVIYSITVKYLTVILGLKRSVSTRNLLKKEFSSIYQSEKYTFTNDNLKKRLVEDIFSNSLQALLRYEDRNSMHYSIEGRVPFLDFNLLKFLFSLPDKAIINLGWNKNILRQATKDLLPNLINKRRNKIGFTTPEDQWFMRMKNKIYQIFLSESFVKRPYFNQKEVLKAFQLFIEGKFDDTMVFWRFLNLELWLRIFFDPKGLLPRSGGLQPRTPEGRAFRAGPNQGKKLEIEVDGKKYSRYPIKTDLFKKGDNYEEKIKEYTIKNVLRQTQDNFSEKNWFLVVSEKIVAIAQGRSYFLWEIKPNIFAKVLSNFVTKTPYGIGLGSPWTMQLAIQEVGLLRILLATTLSALTKPFGFKGIFYQVAGRTVAAIDGPTEYSLYPSNVSAKLGPKDPQRVAENIKLQITNNKSISNFKFQISNFLGVVIIDANDIGRNVLGNSTDIPNETIEKIFKDNPMGQADEQTPIILVESL